MSVQKEVEKEEKRKRGMTEYNFRKWSKYVKDYFKELGCSYHPKFPRWQWNKYWSNVTNAEVHDVSLHLDAKYGYRK
jgi:hypothetical protein